MHLHLASTFLIIAGLWSADTHAPDLPALQQQLVAQALLDRSLLTNVDLDRDGVVSQVEVVVWLYGHQSAARKRTPTLFAVADTNADQAISRSELTQLVQRTAPEGFTMQTKPRSLRPDRGLGQAAAIGTSIGIGGSSSAYVFFGQQQAYIQDYNIVNGQYDPVIGVLSSGVMLEVGDVIITTRRTKR